MPRKARYLQLIPLLPISYLKNLIKIIISDPKMTPLEKQFLIWLVHTYVNSGMNAVLNQEGKWFERQRVTGYTKKTLKLFVNNYLAKHVYKYYSSSVFMDTRQHEAKSFTTYMSIILGNNSLTKYIMNEEDNIHSNTWKDPYSGMANPFIWQADLFKFSLSLPANKTDIDSLLKFMNSASNSAVNLMNISLSVRYCQANIVDVPFLDLQTFRKNIKHIHTALKLLPNYNNNNYSSYAYLMGTSQLLGLLYWSLLPVYVNKTLSYVLPVVDEIYTCWKNGQIPYSWLTLNNMIIYSCMYMLPCFTKSINHILIELLKKAMNYHNSLMFSLQMLNSLVEGLRWSLLNGYFDLAETIRSHIKQDMPSVLPGYLIRSLLQTEVLDALIKMDNKMFDLVLNRYKSDLKAYPPNSFFVLFVSAIYELIFSINICDIDRAFKVGERVYQLAYKYNKLREIAKLLRQIGRYGIGNPGRKFWTSMYEEVIKHYKKDPFSINIEKGFPLLAWLYHKKTLEPFEKLLNTYVFPISLSEIQSVILNNVDLNITLIESCVDQISTSAHHLLSLLTNTIG